MPGIHTWAGMTAAATAFAQSANAEAAKIMIEEMMVPAFDAGIEIFVRNKRRFTFNSLG
jgi:hypothetical protein